MGLDGKILTEIQAAHYGEEDVLSADLVLIDPVPYIVFSTSKWSTSSLLLTTPDGTGGMWRQFAIAEFSDNVTQVAAAAHGKGLVIAYRSVQDISTVGLVECTLDGGSISCSSSMSTEGANSACPDVVVNDGIVTCIWQEEHRKGSELVLFSDALMEKPDRASIGEALDDNSPEAMLAFDTTLKSSVSTELDILDTLIASSDESAAVALIDRMLDRIKKEGTFPDTTNPKTIDKAAKDMAKIVSVLEATRDSLLNPNVIGLPVVDLSQAYIYDLKVRVLSPNLSSITWYTSVATENDEVVVFAESFEDAMTITQANQGLYHNIDIATEANTTYAFTSRSWLKDDFLEASGNFSSGLTIENLTMDSNGTSCVLSWTTPVECNSTLTFSLQGEAHALSPVNATDGLVHTSTLTNLTLGEQYEITITITSERFPCASSSITSSFIMPSTEEDEEQEIAAGTDHAVRILSIPMRFSAQPPYVSITNVASSIIGAHTARITWTTNVVATSVVEYGLTTSYGLSTTGTNSTSHTVDLTGLGAFSLYHFRVRSVEVADPTDSAVSSDAIFRVVYNDDNRGSDAGNTFATAMRTAAGLHGGWLDASSDSADYYSINLAVGQLLSVRLIVPTVPSGYNYNLGIYNPSNVLKAWSNGSGSAAESASFTANVAGLWEVAVDPGHRSRPRNISSLDQRHRRLRFVRSGRRGYRGQRRDRPPSRHGHPGRHGLERSIRRQEGRRCQFCLRSQPQSILLSSVHGLPHHHPLHLYCRDLRAGPERRKLGDGVLAAIEHILDLALLPSELEPADRWHSRHAGGHERQAPLHRRGTGGLHERRRVWLLLRSNVHRGGARPRDDPGDRLDHEFAWSGERHF